MNVLNSFPQASATSLPPGSPLICFSHLRWDFVLQRPQHLMQRFSRHRQVFFFEEFIPTDHHLAYLEIHPFEGTSVKAVRPRIPHWWSDGERQKALGRLLDDLIALHGAKRPILLVLHADDVCLLPNTSMPLRWSMIAWTSLRISASRRHI